ncbi:hypothetical protein NSPZN2_40025 [Nitrospira defluvii]|uniref:Uncharacterized protein n=1 Tax=Nitrospira defluvii TaxID=330214 RepID=A0ABM8RQ61_9BACT|nr:hypothetical protein NSPZN2_40025 [Nitrospira defluvii]
MNPHLDAGHANLGILPALAGVDVESPSVPRAYDQVTMQTAFTQRPACMGAGVVDGPKRAVYIAEREKDTVDFNGAAGPGRDVIHLGDGDVVGVRIHGIPSQITGKSGLPQGDVTLWVQSPKRLISLVACGIDKSDFSRGRVITAPPFAIL